MASVDDPPVFGYTDAANFLRWVFSTATHHMDELPLRMLGFVQLVVFVAILGMADVESVRSISRQDHKSMAHTVHRSGIEIIE